MQAQRTLHAGRKRSPVPELRSPTIRRRELGALLRTLRLEQGLTVDQVAGRLLCSPSKVSRMETGQRGATARDVRDLCDLYGVTSAGERARMAKLAAEGKQQGWWQSYELDYFATYVGLEEAATTLCYYQSTIVPGLLQTAAYARAMHRGSMPAEFTPERADELIEVRIRRQQVLTRDPPMQLRVVLDEAVLHRVVGSRSVMAAQLRHFIAVASRPNVTLQVIPFSVGAHPAMENMFNIIDFGDVVPRVVYVEGLMGWLFLERENDIARYTQVFDYLCELALDPQETIELISEVGTRYTTARSPSSEDVLNSQ
jgi:transcriptional regulator with XRE-family HTH domain